MNGQEHKNDAGKGNDGRKTQLSVILYRKSIKIMPIFGLTNDATDVIIYLLSDRGASTR